MESGSRFFRIVFVDGSLFNLAARVREGLQL